MSDDDKWVRLVARLNAMTQDGKLHWDGPRKTTNAGGRTFVDYVAPYKDKAFRIRYASGGDPLPRPDGVPRPQIDMHYLAIVDEAGNQLFTIPRVPGISDLYESITYLQSGIKTLIDELLDEQK